MTKRRKPDQKDVNSATQKKDDAVRLRFGGAVLELTPTAEYPIQVLQTDNYEGWINGIADPMTRARIISNINKIRRGLFGDWKEIGLGVFEMRMDFGPGYRVYYAKHDKTVIILLGGGEKGSQQKDITDAKRLWKELKSEITKV